MPKGALASSIKSPTSLRRKITTGRATGKVILFGEHAVVYGRPAIAVPVTQVRAQATVEDAGERLTLIARDLGAEHRWGDAVPKSLQPLVALAEATLAHLGIPDPPALRITLESTVPIARGLGSGAAISTALVRGLSQHLGHPLAPEEVSPLVYTAEGYYHGNPSGIDNTVIAYEKPIYFVKGQEPQIISLAQPLPLVIADSGVESPTKKVVQEVREAREKNTQTYDALFDEMAKITDQARIEMASGALEATSGLMSKNHQLLRRLGISTPLLDSLVAAAEAAGAWGAKLSGAGQGGNIVALVRPGTEDEVARALQTAGAKSIIYTQVT